jgi:hypothetical protein
MAPVIIAAIIGLLAGFFGSLIRYPSQSKEAMAKSLEVVEKAYSGVITTLQKDVSYLKEKIIELESQKCERENCPRRLPPKNQ